VSHGLLTIHGVVNVEGYPAIDFETKYGHRDYLVCTQRWKSGSAGERKGVAITGYPYLGATLGSGADWYYSADCYRIGPQEDKYFDPYPYANYQNSYGEVDGGYEWEHYYTGGNYTHTIWHNMMALGLGGFEWLKFKGRSSWTTYNERP
jgi:hypothetical protein